MLSLQQSHTPCVGAIKSDRHDFSPVNLVSSQSTSRPTQNFSHAGHLSCGRLSVLPPTKMHRPSRRDFVRMFGYSPNHRRRLIDTANMPAAPPSLPGGQARSSASLGSPPSQYQDYADRIRPTALPGQRNVPQTRSGLARQPARGAADDSDYEMPDDDEDEVEQKVRKPARDMRLTGVDLETRRRQARGRILAGGWKPDIAEMAIECAESRLWTDTTGRNHIIREFAKDAANLGELCNDIKAIRGFLDANIHKFIAFHAMEKNFEVPSYVITKAKQRTGDRVLKYPWLRSFIREYQGLPSGMNESWVQGYKEHPDESQASVRTSQPAPTDNDGSIRVAIVTAPETVTLGSSFANDTKDSSPERHQLTRDNKRHSGKRRHVFDDSEDLENHDLTKRIKTEPTEDDFFGFHDQGHEADTSGAGMQDLVRTGGEDNSQEIIHNKRRTLTVMFHGMKDDDAKESEHVQVYVPRTAKGVTINLL